MIAPQELLYYMKFSMWKQQKNSGDSTTAFTLQLCEKLNHINFIKIDSYFNSLNIQIRLSCSDVIITCLFNFIWKIFCFY